MKTKNIFSLFLAAFLVISIIASGSDKPTKSNPMPDKVKAVIEKSCFGCHNTASKNEDAKEELDFKQFDSLSLIKKVGAYKKIGETIEEGEMPPKKFLAKFPEKKLTDEEKQLLMDWSKTEAEALVKSK
jgi:uncharacterized membrane protein